MDDLPEGGTVLEPANLRFLRRLVTVLTATMIVGMVTVVTLLVLRFNQSTPVLPVLPNEIMLPAGQTATAITHGSGWFAIVTDAGQILIYAADGQLRQTVDVGEE